MINCKHFLFKLEMVEFTCWGGHRGMNVLDVNGRGGATCLSWVWIFHWIAPWSKECIQAACPVQNFRPTLGAHFDCKMLHLQRSRGESRHIWRFSRWKSSVWTCPLQPWTASLLSEDVTGSVCICVLPLWRNWFPVPSQGEPTYTVSNKKIFLPVEVSWEDLTADGKSPTRPAVHTMLVPRYP